MICFSKKKHGQIKDSILPNTVSIEIFVCFWNIHKYSGRSLYSFGHKLFIKLLNYSFKAVMGLNIEYAYTVGAASK